MQRFVLTMVPEERVNINWFRLKNLVHMFHHHKEYVRSNHHKKQRIPIIPVTILLANGISELDKKTITLPMMKIDFLYDDICSLIHLDVSEQCSNITKIPQVKPYMTTLWHTKQQSEIIQRLPNTTPLIDPNYNISSLIDNCREAECNTSFDKVRTLSKEIIITSLRNITLGHTIHTIII